MLNISFIVVIIGGLIFLEKLRSIQKRTRSYLKFNKLQSEIMDFMRKEGTNISDSDYRKAREIIEMNYFLIDVYSCKRHPLFHIKTFFSFLNTFAKPVYDIDVKVQSISPTNEKLKELQSKLVRTIEWSIFYSTPLYILFVVIFSLSSFLIYVFAVKRTQLAFYSWYKRVILEQFKNNVSEKFHYSY